MEYIIVYLLVLQFIIIGVSIFVINYIKRGKKQLFDYRQLADYKEIAGTAQDATISTFTIHAVKYNLN